MAVHNNGLDATIAAAAGADPALLAELHAAFRESLDKQIDLLARARCDGNWVVAAQRLKSLGASFHAPVLVKLADLALDSAPGDPQVLSKLAQFAGEIPDYLICRSLAAWRTKPRHAGVRIALIATDDAGYDPARHPAVLGGRALSLHQLDFALGQGCEKVLCLGHGASPEAIALRHAAERAGAQFQVLRGARDLPAAVRGEDELLVFARGLLPDSPRAFEALRKGPVILALPVQPGAGAGFELLDLTTAWGGAMAIPGRLADRLDLLPDDAEPISGLLRIARQAGVPERELPESELAEGRWGLLRNFDQALAAEPGWMRRRLPAASPLCPTRWFARALLRRFGAKATASRRAGPLTRIFAGFSLAGALTAAWFSFPLAGFALLIIAALAIELGDGITRLGRPSFAPVRKPSRLSKGLRIALDLSLVAVAVLALPGALHRRLFLALLPVGLLHVKPLPTTTNWRGIFADRALLVIALALAVGFDTAEKGFMAAALVLLAMRIWPYSGNHG